MKNWVIFLVLISLFCSAASGLATDSLMVNASAAVLINAGTGEVLYSKNSDSIMIPASTTKIMTAIIAIEKGNLTQKVKISPRAAAKPGSSMHLRAGEAQTLQNLLYGLLLPSGNDAATAIAECIAGTEEKFARMMTAKARELGMEKTRFKNASGLPAAGHYTTAYDMALLADYALKNPTFAEIVQTKTTSVPSSRSKATRSLTNHNKLLWEYPYTTGIKTGYTRRAGPCLVASASQNGITLVSVVLKSNTMYDDSINLFNYGFQSIYGTPTEDTTSDETQIETQTELIYCP